jgi:hypothetical protein
MLKYGDFLTENLAANVVAEPSSEAAAEAKKLGLTYLGFGRYADETGRVAYTVIRNRLVPFKHSEQLERMVDRATNGSINDPEQEAVVQKQLKISRQVKDSDIRALTQTYKDIVRNEKEFKKAYNPANFAPEEISALQAYTNDLFQPINNYLYKGFDDTIDPQTAQDVQNTIVTMDNMLARSQAPFDHIVYTGLTARYDPSKFSQGKDYIFRGYTSCSLDYNTALDVYTQVDQQAPKVLLQIDIQRGQNATYVDSLTGTTFDKEVVLPRGSKIRILSGPHNIDDEIIVHHSRGEQIALFHCQLVQDL